MNLINKFYSEHAVAYPIIIGLQKSNAPLQDKIKQILDMWDRELLPHFTQEEREFFTDDFGSTYLLEQHKEAHALINALKITPTEDNIQLFCALMLKHIKQEEAYFREVKAKRTQLLYAIGITFVVTLLIVFAVKF